MYKKNAVGVDIGGTKMHMLAKFNGKYIEKIVPTGIECTQEMIKSHLNDFIDTLPFQVESIGIALPGLVIDNNTLLISDVLPHLNGLDSTFFTQGKYSVKFINDVKAATITEAQYHQTAHTVVVIMVGTGIAAGVAVNGEIFTGSQGFAGEIGNARIPYKGELVSFDSLSSGAAILKRSKCSIKELLQRLEKGSSDMQAIIDEAGYYFGVALGLVIQFFNPDIIVVGGSTSTYPGYMEIAKRIAKENTLSELFEHTKIVAPQDMRRIVAKWGLLSD